MKCHYEVLAVSRDADESEIKTAYRKLALIWHPDKNLDNSEYAKEQFQIVQQAYDVLSDRQERAWYDKHREQILRGCDSEFQDQSLDVFQYFTTTCFKGYGDNDDGFYAVYRNVFDKIAKEDMEFINKEEFCEIPNYGNSRTDYEQVSEFYIYWSNYSTKKNYFWLDPHDIKEFRDRRYIKLIEKENKKVRQKAKKERNEEIRNLVAFVRKRDKRVQAQKKIQEQKLLEDKKKRESLSKQKRLERRQLINEAGVQPEWAKFDNVKSELEEIERNLAKQFGEEVSDSECEEEEEHFNNLYCVACNKVFKTPKAFENHELSRKHRENVEALKGAMLDDDESFDGESNASSNSKNCDEREENSIIKEQVNKNEGSSKLDLGWEENSKSKQKKKNKKPRNILSVEENAENTSEEVRESDSDFDFGSNKKQRKKKNSNKPKLDLEVNGKTDPGQAEAVKVVVDNKKLKKDGNNKQETATDNLSNVDTNHSCVTCKSYFPSKNKLFDHLKKTGHGVYIPSNVKSKNRKKHIREN